MYALERLEFLRSLQCLDPCLLMFVHFLFSIHNFKYRVQNILGYLQERH